MTIAKLGTVLRLTTLRGSSNNIWLAIVLIFLLTGMNYSSLVMPGWLLNVVMVFISFLAVVSLFSYGFWVSKSWQELTQDGRLAKILYLVVLSLMTLLVSYITYRIVVSNGGQV